jgi:hypothetical protein
MDFWSALQIITLQECFCERPDTLPFTTYSIKPRIYRDE